MSAAAATQAQVGTYLPVCRRTSAVCMQGDSLLCKAISEQDNPKCQVQQRLGALLHSWQPQAAVPVLYSHGYSCASQTAAHVMSVASLAMLGVQALVMITAICMLGGFCSPVPPRTQSQKPQRCVCFMCPAAFCVLHSNAGAAVPKYDLLHTLSAAGLGW